MLWRSVMGWSKSGRAGRSLDQKFAPTHRGHVVASDRVPILDSP